MATLKLKDIQKIYPHSSDQKKAKKKGQPEKKTNLQVTEQGVIAVQKFNLDIKDKEFIVSPPSASKKAAPNMSNCSLPTADSGPWNISPTMKNPATS